MSKIAFCFLTYSDLDRPKIWMKYLENNLDKCNIYIHNKFPLKNNFFKKYIIKNKTKTYKKTDIFIVFATLLLIRSALENKENKKIIFLSQSCLPIIPFNELYDTINKNNLSYIKTFHNNKKGRYYSLSFDMKDKISYDDFVKQHPNMILDREDAEFIIKKNHYLNYFKYMLCPDEHFFINIFNIFRKDKIKNKQICFCNFNLKNTQGKEHKLITKDLIKQLRKLGFFFMRKITKKSFIYKDFIKEMKLN